MANRVLVTSTEDLAAMRAILDRVRASIEKAATAGFSVEFINCPYFEKVPSNSYDEPDDYRLIGEVTAFAINCPGVKITVS